MKPGDKIYCYNDYTVSQGWETCTFWCGYYYTIHRIEGVFIWVAKNNKTAVIFDKFDFSKYFMTDNQLRKNKLLKINGKGE